MRIFWSLIAILVLATAGVVILRRVNSTTPAAQPTSIVQATPAPQPNPASRPENPPVAPTPAPQPVKEKPAAAAIPVPNTTPLPVPAQPEPAALEPIDPERSPAQPEAQPTDTPLTEKPADTAPAPTTPPVEATKPTPPTPHASAATTAAAPPSDKAAEPTPASSTPPATVTTPGAPKSNKFTPSPEVLAAAESAKGPPTLVKQSDGTTLVDGRFVIKGEGSQSDPYEVTWEQLMSAQETYKPRLGLKVIPGRLDLLHDKWVKVSGYVAFPVMAQGPDEMLMMLNQWDGCCIGVPPTPYDAIEVKLAKPAEGETRLLIMGTVIGKLKVDPYLVKDWLVSLYIMDEATVVKQSGAPIRDSVVQQEHLAP